MPIVKQTPTILEFREKSYGGCGLVIFGAVLLIPIGLTLGFSLAVILLGENVKTLKCNRLEPTQVACEFISSGSISSSSINIRKAEKAEVEFYEDSEGDTHTKVILVTEDGRIPLDLTNSTENSTEVVNQINAFISNQQQKSLVIKQDDRWILSLFFMPFMLIGLMFLRNFLLYITNITMGPDSLTLDKNSGKMYLKVKKSKILSKWDLREYWLHEIKRIKVIEKIDSDGDTTYERSLLLR
ncbi:MAG: hypothetical protein WBV73_30605 [Phormidium sp.]